MSHRPALVTRALALALVASILAPTFALAAPPSLDITFMPASPDGDNGWWLTPPSLYATTDQDAVVHWSWNGGAESTSGTSADMLSEVTSAEEGARTFSARAVNASDEWSGMTTVNVYVDGIAPDQPDPPTAAIVAGPAVALLWEPASDDGSGIARYRVYRNSTGLPFAQDDLVATLGATSFVDGDPLRKAAYYGVSAIDVAGNESPISPMVRVSGDFTPPPAPIDFQAWRNAEGSVRLTWTPPTDASGIDSYFVQRTVMDGPEEDVAVLPGDASDFRDHDLPAEVVGPVTYRLTAVDGAGLASAGASAALRVDVVAPTMPGAPIAAPVFGGPTSDASEIDFSWQTGADEASGVWGSVVREHLSDGGAIDTTLAPGLTTHRLSGRSTSTTMSVAVTDRAGNISAFSPTSAGRSVPTPRRSGTDRYATAIALSRSLPGTVSAVVIAAGEAPFDASCAGPLARLVAGGGRGRVLLVPGCGVTPALRAEILRIQAREVYVVGGPVSVPPATLAALDRVVPGRAYRIAGADRYATAAAIANRVVKLAGKPERVWVTNGLMLLDATCAGAAGSMRTEPVILGTARGLPAVSYAAIRSAAPSMAVVVGAEYAIPDIPRSLAPQAKRISAMDRLGRAREVAAAAITTDHPLTEVMVAGYRAEADAVVAAGAARGPLLLARKGTDMLFLRSWLSLRASRIGRATIVGGPLQVDEDVRRQIWGAMALPEETPPVR